MIIRPIALLKLNDWWWVFATHHNLLGVIVPLNHHFVLVVGGDISSHRSIEDAWYQLRMLS
jgi:hypothetical protein